MVFLNLWEEELIKQGKSKNTVDNYKADIIKFRNWFKGTYGQEFDNKVIEMDIKSYQSYLLNVKGQSINTITRNIVSLIQFNRFLGICGATNNNLNSLKNYLIRKVDNNDINIKTLSNNDLNKLKRAFYKVENKRDISIFEILINSGIRVSELISLELQDILITNKNGQNNYSYLRIRQGKGGIYREIPLNNTSKNAIENYLEIRPISDYNFLILGERGPLQRFAINKILAKYCNLAQIDPISPHILRHTFATRLLTEYKIDLVTISRILGHSSSQVTENYYINTTIKDKIDAIKSLDF